MMSIIDQLEANRCTTAFKEGGKARVRNTGQIVRLKRVSVHGISLVSVQTGGEYFMSNRFLEPLSGCH